MKKLLTLLLSILVCLSLVGCNKKDNTTNETVIEPTINEIVEVPNNTTQEEVVIEEVKDNTTLSYWVNFLNKDGSVLQRTVYKYGETPSYKGTTPTYTDYAYYYSFKGWDKQTSPVKGTQTYTALYDIVAEVPSEKEIPVVPEEDHYLTFTANIAGSTIALNKYNKLMGNPSLDVEIQIKPSSTNVLINDVNVTSTEWTDYTWNGSNGAKITLTNVNDSVQFKAKSINSTFSKIFDYFKFYMTGRIAASGDVTGLLNGVGGNATLSENCFQSLFNGCTALTTAPSLPSTTLTNNCYSYMFNGCTSLATAPSLPATTLAEFCYNSMFSGCESLVSAPKISAIILSKSCCNNMFSDCKSLVNAPVLHATTLAESCYCYMFDGCTSLTKAPALPATTLAKECYKYMFNGCTSLTTPPALPATTLTSECYNSMFYGCTNLKVTMDSTKPNATKIFTCPSYDAVDTQNVSGMFNNCSIDGVIMNGTPAANNDYYYWYTNN